MPRKETSVVEERLRFVARLLDGEGSHGRLYLGGRMTMVKRTELSKSLLHAMLKELEIEKGDF